VGFHHLSPCPACGARNRIPAAHLADSGRCGACKAALPPLSEPLDVDTDAFDEIVRTAKVPVLVDFWAAWCGPCRAAAPEVKKLAEAMRGRLVVLKVDTESQRQLAQRYSIRGIPHFVILRDGRVVFERSGVAASAEMRRWVEATAVAS
jgi:thioredoxin 2